MSGRPGVRLLSVCGRRDRAHVPWAYSLVGVAELPVWGPAHPLRREAARWVSWAGAATILLGLALSQLWREGPPIALAPPREPVFVDYVYIDQPPSITEAGEPQVKVSEALEPIVPDFAQPVPVDDVQARQSTIPTVAEINEMLRPHGGTDLMGDGNVTIRLPGHAPEPVAAPALEPVPDQLPVRVSIVPAAYPPIARSAMVEGTVMLSVQVGKDGRVAQVRVESGPEMLREAAVASAWTARFRPAICNGQPVVTWVAFPVIFALHAR